MAYIDNLLADQRKRKALVAGALVGGAALMAGFGRAIDKKFPGYKRSTKPTYLFARGALIGGLLSIPAAGFIAHKGVNANVFGNAQRPAWDDSTPKTPEGHMAFKNDIDGTTYFLPAPPKTN
jgi:hypothetical protein